ncbi:hypothetical protein FQN60_012676 [Etheostoma spectabile]|uniref:Uncharacterized protein n=1 Tax=Etheostoma spectabile TaxID=54343 RepID=A0A5J5DBU5_9PERO|nr:hypothetical protein FQN60_012676 [Etheostoma spectabile]
MFFCFWNSNSTSNIFEDLTKQMSKSLLLITLSFWLYFHFHLFFFAFCVNRDMFILQGWS